MFQNFGADNLYASFQKNNLLLLFYYRKSSFACANRIVRCRTETNAWQTCAFFFFHKKDSLILVCFWSVNSDESVNELNAINPHVQDWKDAVKFKLMAVSVEEGKLADRVRPTAIMNGWTFEVFVDINGDLRKALNSTNLPQSFIIKNGKIVYRQSGFESGTENYLFQKVIEFSKQK